MYRRLAAVAPSNPNPSSVSEHVFDLQLPPYGVYHVPSVHYPLVRDLLFSLIFGHAAVALAVWLALVWRNQDYHWYLATLVALSAAPHLFISSQYRQEPRLGRLSLVATNLGFALCLAIPMRWRWLRFLHPYHSVKRA